MEKADAQSHWLLSDSSRQKGVGFWTPPQEPKGMETEEDEVVVINLMVIALKRGASERMPL